MLSFFCAGWLTLAGLSAQTFQGSLLAGITLAQIDGDLLSGFNQPGLCGGLRVERQLSERWSLGLTLAFSQAGSRRQLTDQPAAVLRSVRLNQVELPLLVQFSEWQFQLGAGLAYQRLFGYRFRDITGADVTALYPLRDNQLAFLASGRFRFNERWGAELSWSRSLLPLQAGKGSSPFWGRVIGIQSIIYL